MWTQTLPLRVKKRRISHNCNLLSSSPAAAIAAIAAAAAIAAIATASRVGWSSVVVIASSSSVVLVAVSAAAEEARSTHAVISPCRSECSTTRDAHRKSHR